MKSSSTVFLSMECRISGILTQWPIHEAILLKQETFTIVCIKINKTTRDSNAQQTECKGHLNDTLILI